MKIVFRVDASIITGVGHLSRCLTLANIFKSRGYETNFISRNLLCDAQEKIISNNHKLFLLKDSDISIQKNNDDYEKWLGLTEGQDAQETVEIVKNINDADWLIVDHYGIGKTWHNKLRDHARKIFVIDDLGDRSIDCDLLLNQTHKFDTEIYNNLAPKNMKKLIGSKYILLRDEFFKLRPKAIQKRKNNLNINNILIFFGSVDNSNLIPNILDTLAEMQFTNSLSIKVVIGRDSPNINQIEQKIHDYIFNCEMIVNAENMAELILDADIAIAAGGMNSWERCCLGLPTLIKKSAENQSENVTSLEKSGAVIVWDTNEDLKKELSSVLSGEQPISEIQEKSFEICDGMGAYRVVEEMINAT